MLGFSKQNKKNSKLFNTTGNTLQRAVVTITPKVFAQVLTGNYKTIKDSLPDDTKIVEMEIVEGLKEHSLYAIVESKHFKEVNANEKYPVLGLLYKRKK